MSLRKARTRFLHASYTPLTRLLHRITTIPMTLAYLTKLTHLGLDAAKMNSPPREICMQGTKKILSFCQVVLESPYTEAADLGGFGLRALPPEVRRWIRAASFSC